MSLNNNTVILKRDGENRVAIITCNSRFHTGDEVMTKIRTAVSNWIKKTDEGSVAWGLSSNDFNIGDLGSFVAWNEDYKTLVPFLEGQWIYNLEIELFGDDNLPSNFTYDTVLFE
ncbi:MAG: hypothetical protein J7L15_08285 [Clostridiales bacterium]|nr:hypothetical protein [Clostridiales bacterium]